MDISSTNVGNGGGTPNRVARFPWNAGSLLSGRPSAFNWLGYVTYITGVYDQFPTNNTGGAVSNPRFFYYQTITNTTNSGTTNPFSTNARSFETRDNFGYNNTQPSTIFDFTVNGNTTTFTNTLNVINNFNIASGTFTNLNSGGPSTLTMGTMSSHTPSIWCNGTLNPNNGLNNDLSIIAAYGTTTIGGTATNANFKIFSLTVNNGATVQAPSSGTVDLGWQFGTITVNSGGILNFVNGSGVVNLTNSGTTSTCQLANSGTMTFNNITNNSGNTIRPANLPATTAITLNGNLSNSGTFSTTYTSGTTGTIDIIVTGATSSLTSTAQFYRNLTIANTGSTALNSVGVTISGSITIASGRTLTINSGARLITSNSITLATGSPNASCSVNGFLRSSVNLLAPIINATSSVLTFNSGAFYECNATAASTSLTTGLGLPPATWNSSSTCTIMGLTSPTAGTWFGAGISGITFGNFTWNCPNQTTSPNMAGATLTATGTFTMASTGGSADLRLNNTQTTGTITCGNFAQTGGTINFAANVSPALGTLNCSGTFNQTGGTLTESSTGTGKIVMNAASGSQNLTVSGTVSNTINWEIGTGSSTNTVNLLSNLSLSGTSNFLLKSGSTLNFGTNFIDGSTGTFTSETNSTYTTANVSTGGVVTETGVTTAGNVRCGGTKTYHNAANYIFNGASLQYIGAGLTNANNITISNSVGVNLGTSTLSTGPITISGTLTLASGSLGVRDNTISFSGSNPIARTSGTFNATNNAATLAFTHASPITLAAGLIPTTLNNLTINGGGITLSESLTLATVGTLTLTSGYLGIGNSNTLTINGAVSGSGLLRGSSTSSLVINGTAGTVNFDQTTDANRSTVDGSNALANLTLGNAGSVTLGSKTNLFGTLTVGTGATLNTGDGLLVFRNTATSTARLAAVTGTPTFTGAVVVENHINHNIATARGWRLLSSPLTSAGTGGTVTPSVQSNWQSAMGYAGNYGTNFYSPSGTLGMDGVTNRHSLLRFRADTLTTGGWTNINTTGVNQFNSDAQNASTSTNPVFFAFVRGDKSVSAVMNSGTPQSFVSTTLASKGRITFGNKTVNLTGNNNGYAAVGNPFISPVDADRLTFTNIQSNNSIYVWDPKLGSTGLGGYATLTGADNYATNGNMTKNLQTGQAFLVQLNGTSGSVLFEEIDKVSSFSTSATGAGNGLKDIFSTKLHFVNSDGSKLLADAHRLIFGVGYTKSFNIAEDAPKFANGGENLSSKIGTNLLSVDVRPYIQNDDSIFM
ncbi:MAG: beta strand repeat-containing protein, partial [Dolichospermum sp.]